MRSRKALVNTLAGFAYEIVSVICGLILPRLILSHFGSTYNGITSSISQFLTGLGLLEAGIWPVAQAALYKPLAEGNVLLISSVVKTTERFMRRVALIFSGAVLVFACIYPMWVNENFSWIFSFSLIIIISLSAFAQYFFGVTYQILFKADQRHCVINFVRIGTVVLNTIVASLLILYLPESEYKIHYVKLGSAIVFILNPIVINLYAKKRYKLTKKVEYNNNLIGQRWDAFAQELSLFVHNNTDVVVLTIFADLLSVSIYTVYNYVARALHSFFNIFISSFCAAFGNMFAKGEEEIAEKNLRITEVIVYSISTIVFTVAGIMIVPYALLFTDGVNDANYDQPLFALFLMLAGAFASYKIPYNIVASAAGHFKQTRKFAIIEAILNITISILTVRKFGLIGVSIGTLAATAFNTVTFSYYISKNIIKRSQWLTFKHILISLLTGGLIVAFAELFIMPYFKMTVFYWFIFAVMFTVISTVVVLLSNLVFFRKDFLVSIEKVKIMLKKKTKAK